MKRRVFGFLAVMMAAAMLFGGLRPVPAAQAEETAAVEEERPAPDVDLTTLSSTEMLAEATEIMSDPDPYIGKRIRMAGALQAYEYNGRYILTLYLCEGASCCATTMEFNRAGDYTYPDDYPSPGTVVFVEGVLERYEEDGVTYCWLNDAVMQTEKFES